MTDAVSVQILRLPHAEGLPLPAYETAGSAGMDLRAAVPEDQPLTLAPGRRALATPRESARTRWGRERGPSRRAPRRLRLVLAAARLRSQSRRSCDRGRPS